MTPQFPSNQAQDLWVSIILCPLSWVVPRRPLMIIHTSFSSPCPLLLATGSCYCSIPPSLPVVGWRAGLRNSALLYYSWGLKRVAGVPDTLVASPLELQPYPRSNPSLRLLHFSGPALLPLRVFCSTTAFSALAADPIHQRRQLWGVLDKQPWPPPSPPLLPVLLSSAFLRLWKKVPFLPPLVHTA